MTPMGRNRKPGKWGFAGILPLILLAVLIVIPLLLIFLTSIRTEEGWDLTAPFRIIASGNLGSVYANSLWLGLCVVAGTTLLALPLAWMMARTSMMRHRWLDVILLIPFMTPPYIGSMGWILFMQKNGYLEQLLPAAAPLSAPFFYYEAAGCGTGMEQPDPEALQGSSGVGFQEHAGSSQQPWAVSRLRHHRGDIGYLAGACHRAAVYICNYPITLIIR